MKAFLSGVCSGLLIMSGLLWLATNRAEYFVAGTVMMLALVVMEYAN